MIRNVVPWLVAVVGAAGCAFLVAVMAIQGLAAAGVWAGPLAALAGIVAAVAAVWALHPSPQAGVPPSLDVPSWVVRRPAELAAAVRALVGGEGQTVGITTGLYGAGGFGKTTLARMVCADRRVQRRFRGRVYLVTVGRDVRGPAAIAAKVNDVIRLLAGADAAFAADPQLAGQQLGALLNAGPRRLLVLDDVWEPEQLAPFLDSGKVCARLVTTRAPQLLAGRGTTVRVDQMTPEQARALLTSGLPQLNSAVADGLLAVTGCWPLLLRLVNEILADYAQVAADVSAQGIVLVERLRASGPAVVDDVLGGGGRGLDVGEPQQRAQAVRATIGASTNLLAGGDGDRFTELSVFAGDEVVPLGLVAGLWRATAGLDDLQAAQVCKRLAQLGLVSQDSPGRGITMHDVVRDFLRAELGKKRLASLNATLLDTVAADLPPASQLGSSDQRAPRVAWWELGGDRRYMWDHLIEHLLDAGLPGDADAVADDLRWVGARLERFGPAAPAADLAAAGTPRSARLQAVLSRTAHLLAPTEPANAVVDVLHSRVASDADWGPQVIALRDMSPRPRLVNRWPLPDLADPALRRVLTGHPGEVNDVAIAPDGSWLATGGSDRTVRIWDAATGRQRAVLAGHLGRVNAVAIAPDGSWLATGGSYRTVRMWDAVTGRQRAVLAGHPGGVNAIAIAPDGSWLATSGRDRTVRIWDAVTGRQRATLTRHLGEVYAVAIAPDGRWLATGSYDTTVRIWDAVTGRQRAVLTGHSGGAVAVAIAPDGRWVASCSSYGPGGIWDAATGRQQASLGRRYSGPDVVTFGPDGTWLATGMGGTVQIWDTATGQDRAALTGHAGDVTGVAVAPDGSWLASGSKDGTVRIWDAATGRERMAIPVRYGDTTAVAVAPDGRWLASGGWSRTVRIWDAATGGERATLEGHTTEVTAVAVAPDGKWLASSSRDGTVRIWDVASHRQRVAMTRRSSGVSAVAIGPDGSWLASGSTDGTVRIWDVATGRQRAVSNGHADEVCAVAAAPDGSWLASGSKDRTVRIWDVATGRQTATLAGHTSEVTAVAVAPDGSRLASGSKDGTVRIWDAGSGQVRAMMRLDRSVSACAWLDAKALAVGGKAGLYLFDLLTDLGEPATEH